MEATKRKSEIMCGGAQDPKDRPMHDLCRSCPSVADKPAWAHNGGGAVFCFSLGSFAHFRNSLLGLFSS